jgi:hypothetical protein
MGPVLAESGQQMTQNVRFCDRTINIRNDDFGCVVPQENFAAYLLRALELRFNCEANVVWPVF